MGAATATEAKFWRLLAAFERLTDDAGVALRARDFESTATILERRPPLLDALKELSQELGLDRNDPRLQDRLQRLAATEQEHHALLGRLMREATAEGRSLDAARARLRNLDHAYLDAPAAARPTPFFAQG